MKHARTLTKLVAVAGIAALGLTACSAPSDNGGEAGGERTDLTLAVFNGWDEGVATSWLWKEVLEEQGYSVELKNADVAPVYEGLATGDYDFTTDIWLPDTHKVYMDKYGDDVELIGAWNSDSKLTLAVNEDAPITSIEELKDHADTFNNTIIGIEPGAGLTKAMNDRVIPEYGLDDMKFITSSTAAMLTELKAATDKGENIVVTLWEPHRAYGQFPVRNLEDPKGALGGTETINTVASKKFVAEAPQATEWLKNFKMETEMLYDLERAMFIDYDGTDYGPVVQQWIADNQEYVDGLTA